MSDKLIHELSAAITKASFDPKTDTMRFRMVASDTGPDFYGERMSLELFNDFTRRIENNVPVPAEYKSVLAEKSGWEGGMPYVSLSHYKSGLEGKNIPADPEKVYVDGECLKATAACKNNKLGKAVFKSLKDDLENKSQFEDKIRVSIGFLDLAHSHGDYVFERKGLANVCPMCKNGEGNKVYLKGILVHLALTRKPANPRTDAEVEKSMAKQIVTREEDAESIVGKELLDEVLENKSTLDNEPENDLLVVKSETEEVAPVVEEAKVKDSKKEDAAEGPEDGKPDAEDKAEGEDAMGKEDMKKKKMPMKSALDEPFEIIKDKIVEYKSLPRAEALEKIQPLFEALGQAIQSEFPEPTQEKSVVATIDPALTDVLSKMSAVMDAINNRLGSVADEVTILKSQLGATKTGVVAEVPAPRQIVVQRSVEELVNKAMTDLQSKPLSTMEIAQRSVQLQ